ncbi:MAG: NAD(P)-dependent oxidoreductase [Pseudomonadota bacterium]|nr:NAD(P)-dependent oxidoreductase [Pseudomonadota bacterium]
MTLRVGIIGLGKIGRACASNLIADGFSVCALSRPSTVDFVADGGQLCADTAELAASCDVIITCLASEEQMQTVYHGPEGLIAHARLGQTVVEMGTFPAGFKKPLADALRQKGVTMLDCPISGIPPTVLQRNAILYVSGDETAAQSIQPVIDSIGPKSSYVGAFGVGMTTKLVTNLLVVVNSMAVAEAMVLGNLSGLDSERMLKAVGPSAGGSAVLNYRGPMMAQRSYQPAAGPASIVMKDLKYIREHARAVGATTPLVETALDWFERMIKEGRAEDECAGIYEVILDASSGPH